MEAAVDMFCIVCHCLFHEHTDSGTYKDPQSCYPSKKYDFCNFGYMNSPLEISTNFVGIGELWIKKLSHKSKEY